jgi:hypothetical protein
MIERKLGLCGLMPMLFLINILEGLVFPVM